MPQYSWNITGHRGNNFRLGLFHGDRTHHVVLHCNDKIVQIDFSVKESKTYSVFLDHELCEVSIDHTGSNHYEYSCRINQEAQTPLNRERKAQRERQNRIEKRRMMVAASVVLLIVFFLIRSAMA